MQGENKQKYIQVCQETPTKVCAYRLHRSHPEGKAVITVSPHDNNHTDQLFKCTYESRQAHNSIMNLSVSHASRQSHCQHNMLNSSELPCQQGSHRSSIMTPPAPNAVFTKILGHFRQLVPNVRWEISQIWIQYKPIRHMSDEPWKFFIYTANDTPAEILSRDVSHTLLNAILSQHHFSLCRLAFVLAHQGWVSSGRNLFLPGHPEKSGRNLFLPVLSGQNWKKLDKTGKNWKMSENTYHT